MKEIHMAVFDLKQICSEFSKAVNAGNLDAVCDFYTADAVFVTNPAGDPVKGIAAIREVLGGFLDSKPTMDFEHVYLLENGDTALARGKWKMTSKGADGSPSVISANSIEILKRQSDGSWKYIIDHPWGGE